VNTLLTGVAGRRGPAAAAARAAAGGRAGRPRAVADGRGGRPEVVLGPADSEQRAVEDADPELVVVASGNLAMVYLARHPGKLALEDVDARHPGLVRALATHPGIGVVVVGTANGPVALGARGAHRLRDGMVTGEDPLAAYGPRTRDDLLRHQAAAHVGDLVLISLVDPDTDEVAAFEELVGCHGGAGGWQTEAMLVHPVTWRLDTDELIGPEAVHRQLVRWRDDIGLGPPPEPPEVQAVLELSGDIPGIRT
jgi:hypothetical protein